MSGNLLKVHKLKLSGFALLVPFPFRLPFHSMNFLRLRYFPFCCVYIRYTFEKLPNPARHKQSYGANQPSFYFTVNSNYKHLPILLKIKGIIEIIYFLGSFLGGGEWLKHGMEWKEWKGRLEYTRRLTLLVRTRKRINDEMQVSCYVTLRYCFIYHIPIQFALC